VDQVEDRYGVSALAVNMLSLVFMIMYLPGSFLGLYTMERYGMRNSLIVGAVLNALCGWIRYFCDAFVPGDHGAYAVTMVGQVMGAMAQPIFTNLPSRIAGDWFPTSERDLATVVSAMTNPLGNAAGSVVPTLFAVGLGQVVGLMLYQAIWATVLLVAVGLVVRDRPPSPPSAAAALRLPGGHPGHASHAVDTPATLAAPGTTAAATALVPLLDDDGSEALGMAVPDHAHDSANAAMHRLYADFGSLFRNRNFLCLMTAFGIGLGMFNATLTVLAQYIATCGYGSDVAGYAGGALLGAGLVGAFGVGVLLEKTRAYVRILKGGILGCLASTLFMLGSMQRDGTAQLVAAFGVMGFCLIPLLPVSLENAAECTYPVPEDNSAALLLLAGQLIGIVMIFVMTPLIQMNPTADCSTIATPVAGLVAGSMLVAASVLLFFRVDYRRQAAEAARRSAPASPASTSSAPPSPTDAAPALALGPVAASLNGARRP